MHLFKNAMKFKKLVTFVFSLRKVFYAGGFMDFLKNI